MIRHALLTILVLLGSACSRSQHPLSTFTLDPAHKISLWASEPLFADPVAMEIDEDARIYVVQNSGYPLDTNHAGKIWLLTDTNNDGKPDTSTLFADKLTLPTGITRWKKGVLVTDAPNLWYLEDTNNDGKADIKKPVLTGFAFTNPQHTVNSPTYGLDNWIYLAHEGFATAIVYADKFGDHGTDIRFADRPTPTVKNERRNVRFKPDTFQLETTSSTSQYGLGFDDYGRMLTVNNSNHARQEMLAARYLARNPHLLAASSMQDTSDHGAAAQVFFTVKSPRFELLSGAGIFTSACSITWFEGGTLVAEPVHSLVHRDLWTPSGPTYIAKRAQPNTEFLSSSDNWFRPVNFYIGPNPGIYVIDYYRKMIEHPEWMSKDAGEGKDLYDGKDKGRIYLLSPANQQASAAPLPKLSQATNDQLIANLEKPNIWWRRNSQRLLVDRNDANTIAPLQKLARNGKSPLGRLHALWTLEGLNKLESDTLLAALADPEPGVRENGIILAESRLTDPTLTARLLTLANDADPRVRFQLLATLGYLQTPAAAKVRKQLLDRDSEDRWMQMAALSAGSDEALPALTEATRAPGNATPGRTNYLQQLGAIIGARGNPAETNKVLTLATSHQAAWWRAPVLDGLATGIRSRKATLSPNPLLLRLYDDTDAPVSRAALHLLELSGLPPNSAALLVKAVATAKDRTQPAGRRANAIALTALSTNPQPPAFYETQTAPSEPEDVQLAAIRALAKQKGQEPAKFFLTHWRAMTPAIRSEAATAFLTDQQRFTMLLNAIEEGAVQPWSLPLRMRVQMQMNRDPALREKARTLLAGNAGEREKIYQRYLAVVDKQPGDPTKGKATFDNICSKCHKLNGQGSEVGPDLATVRNRTAEALLSDILLPSRSIAQMYEAYVVETQSGQILEGVIGEQTSTTITLVHEQQKKDVIPRASIKQMYVSNLSAMPEDLDKEITPQQAADLIAYLKKP